MFTAIGSTRETVTVVLGEMQDEGLIQIGRRKILITDAKRLARSVHKPVPDLPAASS
jgi:phenylpyruvate tautomerase PptA (4-oxalocrotonate tautomerase family)